MSRQASTPVDMVTMPIAHSRLRSASSDLKRQVSKVDFPDPDSPTTASTSPARSVKDDVGATDPQPVAHGETGD